MNLRKSKESSILNLVRVTAIVSLIIFNLQTSFSPAEAAVSSFSYSVSTQSFTVPAGVTSVTVSMRGGAGGKGGTDGYAGGTPGRFVGLIQGTINVTPGQVITVAVGQGGGSTSACVTGTGAGTAGDNPLSGYDGASGGNAGTVGCSGGGGGGGAATVIIVSGTSVVAGGGGGSGGGNNIRFEDSVQSSTSGSTVAGTTGSAGFGPTGDGGGGGGGGGGVNGGTGGTSAKISGSAEFFGYGGNAGTSTTGGISGLNSSTSTYTESSDGSVSFTYTADSTAPTFTNSATFSIAENTATSTNVATITVNESSTITITSGTDSARFTLVTSDSVTARIRFAAIPNFEAPADVGTNNVYDISVRATDTAGNIANQSIAITVTNVNEAPTITINSSNETHTITQAENISSVLTYTATDVDAGTTLSFSLSGTDAADFSINSSSGALAFSSNPDFEAPADSDTNNSYIIIVTVSDGSLTDTQTVTITITNANESASINAPTVSGTINKGIATTITVTINVAGKVRFFVGGKRISTCKDRTTSGTYPNNTATCSWRPAVTGRQILTATLTPTDNSFGASTSAPTTVQVVRRTTSR